MPYRQDLERTAEALFSYLEDAEARIAPVLRQPSMASLADELGLAGLIHNGGLTGDKLSLFLDVYLDNTTRIQHPACMGHQVSCPLPAGSLAGFIDAFTNNPTAIYEKGAPGATIEFVVINWMLTKIGWKPSPLPGGETVAEPFAGGVLTHGGSLAQLTALAAARAEADPDIWQNGNNPDLVVIAPADSHYSVSRALGILGMGQKALIPAPCDLYGRLLPDQLAPLIDDTKASGKKIMAVVANACSTAAGLYDPLRAIGEICNAARVWLHVDGAHGASALLSDKHKHLLDGIELASSVIWDAHKMLRAPGLAAAVLVKNHKYLDHAFAQEASYLFHDKDQPGVDLLSRTVECTKSALGLKFFMGLATGGEKALGDYVDSCTALALETTDYIEAHPLFECATTPESNIVCFRLKEADDDRHLELRKKLLETGESYISSTMFMGKRWLRFVFMNPATTLQDVEHTLALLLKIDRELGN